jgi:glycerol-3-phosphate acyltransferase PlsY
VEWLVGTTLAIAAYLLGSFPTAYLLVRWRRGVDIRQLGSGNVGALNTYEQLGPWGAALVLATDAAKGVLAVAVPWLVGAADWVIFATTPLVIAGHNWPVFLGFRGGKGAATVVGISFIMVPALTAISAVPCILVIALRRNVVAGITAGFVTVNALLLVTGQRPENIALCYFLTILVAASYWAGKRRRILASVRSGDWRRLLSDMLG